MLTLTKHLPHYIRSPIFLCKGDRDNSILLITQATNKENEHLFVPIAIDVNGALSSVHKILSPYGNDTMLEFLKKSFENGSVLAYNSEKANELLAVTRANSPHLITLTCFDDSIAYSRKSIKKRIKTAFLTDHQKELLYWERGGYDISPYIDDFSPKQLAEIRFGLRDGVDVSKYANPVFAPIHMREIRQEQKKEQAKDAKQTKEKRQRR